MDTNLVINTIWKLLNLITLIIPIYLGVLKYYYKEEYRIKTWNYLSIVFFCFLILVVQIGVCLRVKEIMCQIIPIILFIPLLILYIIYLIDTRKRKILKKYDNQDKIINLLMIISIIMYILVRYV